jgi:hypothetical protein
VSVRNSHRPKQDQLPVTPKVAAATEGGSALPLLNHFLQLRAQHVYLSVDQLAAPRNMKPVSLLALDDEFVGLRNVNGLAYAKPDQLSTIVNRLVAFRSYSFTNFDLFVDDCHAIALASADQLSPVDSALLLGYLL